MFHSSIITIPSHLPNLSLPNLHIPQSTLKMTLEVPQDRPERPYTIAFVHLVEDRGSSTRGNWGFGMNGGRVFTGQLGLHTALSCAIPTWMRLRGGCGRHPNLIRPTSVLTRAVSKIKQQSSPYSNLQFLR